MYFELHKCILYMYIYIYIYHFIFVCILYICVLPMIYSLMTYWPMALSSMSLSLYMYIFAYSNPIPAYWPMACRGSFWSSGGTCGQLLSGLNSGDLESTNAVTISTSAPRVWVKRYSRQDNIMPYKKLIWWQTGIPIHMCCCSWHFEI